MSDALSKNTKPLFSVILPTYNPHLAFLNQAIESVRAQSHSDWELCVADDASTDDALPSILRSYQTADPRINVCIRKTNGHISEASNTALAMATGEWVVLMDHDDLLAPNALEGIAKVIQERPNQRLIYSDEDKVDNKHFFDPYFKPSWNRDLLLSQNYFCHLMAIHRSVVENVGGFRVGYEGSQDHDLALRVVEKIREDQIYHIPKILYHWRTHSQSTALSGEAKPYTVTAGEKAINDHLQRTRVSGRCAHDGTGGYRVKYQMPEKLVGVSAIIHSRGNQVALRRCIMQLQSIDQISSILVLTASPEGVCKISTKKLPNDLLVFQKKDGEDLSAYLNSAADHSEGDFLFLLNDCVEGMDIESLHEMISLAARPDIGAVGGMGLFPDGRVRQAGLLLDPDRISEPAFHCLKADGRGYMGRLTLIQNYSAVSKDCMMIEKRKFVEVGGFDEKHLASHYLDVDLCLRLKDAGYRTLWTPYAKFTDSSPRFSPSKILGRFSASSRKDKEWMQKRWGDLLSNDPAYNPNLNQKKKDFNFKWPPKEE